MSTHEGILTKKQIISRIKEGKLKFEPALDSLQLQPHAIDLRLGYTFLIPRSWEMTEKGRVALDPGYREDRSNFEVVELEHGQFFDILPNEYVIFTSLEFITLSDDLMAVLYPRSSVNRRGLSVDLTGIIDAGYYGQLIIPVRNNTETQTIRVYPGERFCTLTITQLGQPAEVKESRFHGKDAALAVSKHKEADTRETDYVMEGKLQELKKKYPIT